MVDTPLSLLTTSSFRKISEKFLGGWGKGWGQTQVNFNHFPEIFDKMDKNPPDLTISSFRENSYAVGVRVGVKLKFISTIFSKVSTKWLIVHPNSSLHFHSEKSSR